MPIIIEPEGSPNGLNLPELVALFKAQGFDYLTTPECEQIINDAYLVDICDDQNWPFLEAEADAAGEPVLCPDLGAVEYVLDVSQETKLDPLKKARITDGGTNLAEAGTPLYYYITGGNTIHTYPVSATDTIEVRYWRVPAPLKEFDYPVLPPRYHSLIIDAARVRGYENSDDWELAGTALSRFEVRLNQMKESLGTLQHDAPDDFIVITDPYV